MRFRQLRRRERVRLGRQRAQRLPQRALLRRGHVVGQIGEHVMTAFGVDGAGGLGRRAAELHAERAEAVAHRCEGGLRCAHEVGVRDHHAAQTRGRAQQCAVVPLPERHDVTGTERVAPLERCRDLERMAVRHDNDRFHRKPGAPEVEREARTRIFPEARRRQREIGNRGARLGVERSDVGPRRPAVGELRRRAPMPTEALEDRLIARLHEQVLGTARDVLGASEPGTELTEAARERRRAAAVHAEQHDRRGRGGVHRDYWCSMRSHFCEPT